MSTTKENCSTILKANHQAEEPFSCSIADLQSIKYKNDKFQVSNTEQVVYNILKENNQSIFILIEIKVQGMHE
ncbi:hypothetical protein Sjap_020095 [Stephania japonica]|uniref:Uncharacterized protein n=1 Tax=Stephania japonica TaxID=461633 RepID=A0AAP0HZZ2_9MAGN